MREYILSFSKTIISALVLIGIIVGGLVVSLYVLKDEAVKTHLKIATLHANTFSEQIYQTFHYIDLTTENIITDLRSNRSENQLNKLFKVFLSNTPYVRSINILNEDKKVIYTSNKDNKGLEINIDGFYPKPLFNQQILRFGKPKFGRDIYDTFKEDTDNTISFLPLVKKVIAEDKTYYLLINLNNEYFSNRYHDSLNNYHASLEIIRFDGVLLFSSQNSSSLAKKIKVTSLFEDAQQKSISSGIEQNNNKRYMSAYHLTDIYPLNIAIKLDYEKSLIEWEDKRRKVILLITILVSSIVFLILLIIYRKNKARNKEIELQREQLNEQKKFKALFEQNIYLAAIVEDDGTIDDINKNALEFLDKSYDDVKKIKFYDLDCWNEEDKIWLKDIFLEFEKKVNISQEVTIRDSKGNEHIIDFLLKSIDVEGQYKVVALSLDITEKKEKDEKLKHAYIVYQNTHDGIMITDKDANILDVNNAFVDSSGYKLEEIKGQNPRLLKSGKVSSLVYKDMWESLKEKGYWNGELKNKSKDGTYYDELLTINSVYDEKDDVSNYIGVFTNITKQKNQEAKLKEQEHLLFQQSKMASMGEMLENIAHQWRQPLSVISMSASGILLKKQFDMIDDEYLTESLEGIINNTKHLSKTIDDFRDFFKPNKAKKEVFISDVIERTLTIVSSKFQNREISVYKEIDEIKVEVYDNELIQVIMNILKNSQDILEKMDAEDRLIFIEAKQIEQSLVIRLKDSGGGIKDEIINKVFEPYFTTKHQSQGTGIGLYMSEEIISKHMDGKLSVHNEEYQFNNKTYKGAVFVIEIPII